MKKAILGILVMCAPACFASANAPAQYYKHDAVKQQQAQTHKKQNKIPNQSAQHQQKKIHVQKSEPRSKHVTKRRVVKRYHEPVVVEHHVYREPRRVIVRKMPRQQTVVVKRRPLPPPPQRVTRVRRYHHYDYQEPRVIVRPAPVQMSFGYVIR
ncbi:MAG: hypothetical protein AB7V32_02960 [Candidatus Berkiella sp.]